MLAESHEKVPKKQHKLSRWEYPETLRLEPDFLSRGAEGFKPRRKVCKPRSFWLPESFENEGLFVRFGDFLTQCLTKKEWSFLSK